MKEKVFIQKSVILYCCLFLFLTIMSLCVYAAIVLITQGINSFLRWAYLFVIIGSIIFIAYTFIRLARNRIILKSDEIFVPEHWGSSEQKIQFETHIKYEEINNIYIITSTKNSLNKESKWIFTPMPYIVFECENNIKKAINVFYYSKKQVINMIDEVIQRAKSLNNKKLLKNGKQIFLDFTKSKNTKL